MHRQDAFSLVSLSLFSLFSSPSRSLLLRVRSPVRARAERVVFDGFEHKLPRSSIYSVPSAGLDSTTGKPLADVLRVDSSVPLSQLGLDSLDLVELMVAVEREFQIELQDEEHDSIKNIGDIVEMIHEHPRAQ